MTRYAIIMLMFGMAVSGAPRCFNSSGLERLHVGWDGAQRVHGPVIHIAIIGDKVWIQYDGTNRPVADELIAAGIPQQDIVLAWHPRELRHHTGFAVD
jgi:hypothetical protein